MRSAGWWAVPRPVTPARTGGRSRNGPNPPALAVASRRAKPRSVEAKRGRAAPAKVRARNGTGTSRREPPGHPQPDMRQRTTRRNPEHPKHRMPLRTMDGEVWPGRQIRRLARRDSRPVSGRTSMQATCATERRPDLTAASPTLAPHRKTHLGQESLLRCQADGRRQNCCAPDCRRRLQEKMQSVRIWRKVRLRQCSRPEWRLSTATLHACARGHCRGSRRRMHHLQG